MTVQVEVFTLPGCPYCAGAVKALAALSGELEPGRFEWRALDVIEHLDYAVELGVTATPAIVIDQKLVFTGAPSMTKLREHLGQPREDVTR